MVKEERRPVCPIHLDLHSKRPIEPDLSRCGRELRGFNTRTSVQAKCFFEVPACDNSRGHAKAFCQDDKSGFVLWSNNLILNTSVSCAGWIERNIRSACLLLAYRLDGHEFYQSLIDSLYNILTTMDVKILLW